MENCNSDTVNQLLEGLSQLSDADRCVWCFHLWIEADCCCGTDDCSVISKAARAPGGPLQHFWWWLARGAAWAFWCSSPIIAQSFPCHLNRRLALLKNCGVIAFFLYGIYFCLQSLRTFWTLIFISILVFPEGSKRKSLFYLWDFRLISLVGERCEIKQEGGRWTDGKAEKSNCCISTV